MSVKLMILASLERGCILNVPGLTGVLEYIGARSYSIYLGHVLLILVYNDLYFRYYERIPDFFKLTRTGYALQFVLFLAVMCAHAETTYRLVGKPCIGPGKRIIGPFMEVRALAVTSNSQPPRCCSYRCQESRNPTITTTSRKQSAHTIRRWCACLLRKVGNRMCRTRPATRR